MDALVWLIGIGGAIFLVYRFPRPSLIFAGGVVALVAGAGAVTYIQEENTARQIAKIEGVVFYNHEGCSEEYPMFVGIVNRADNTIERVRFHVEAHRDGYSDPLYRTPSTGYESDKIIASGEGFGHCYRRPGRVSGRPDRDFELFPPDTLVWTVTDIRPTFR